MTPIPQPTIVFVPKETKEKDFAWFKSNGFAVKNASWDWSNEDIANLHQAVKDISKNPDSVHLKKEEDDTIYYYISQYYLNGVIDPKQVKHKFMKMHFINADEDDASDE